MFSNNHPEYSKFFNEYKNFINLGYKGNLHSTLGNKLLNNSKNYDIFYFASTNSFENRKTFLIVPSIFNSPEILFINGEINFIDNLRLIGDVYIIKWLQVIDKHFKIENYVLEVVDIIKLLYIKNKISLNLIGHCIGGTISLNAVAKINKKFVTTLTMLTAPWDFSHFSSANVIYEYFGFDNLINDKNFIPKTYIQILFFLLFPENLPHKILKYFSLKTFEEKELYLKVEQWLISGNNLSKKTFLDIIENLIIRNVLAKNEWYIGNELILTSHIDIPICQLIAEKDKLVPESSILALHQNLKNSTIFRVEGGHINYLISNKINIFFQFYKLWLGGKNA